MNEGVKRERSSGRTTVADSLAAMNNTDRLLADHLHRTEGSRLELEVGLFKTRARVRLGAGTLGGGPCGRVVGRLGRDRRRGRGGGGLGRRDRSGSGREASERSGKALEGAAGKHGGQREHRRNVATPEPASGPSVGARRGAAVGARAGVGSVGKLAGKGRRAGQMTSERSKRQSLEQEGIDRKEWARARTFDRWPARSRPFALLRQCSMSRVYQPPRSRLPLPS